VPAVVIALSIAALVLISSFGVLAMNGRRTILRTLQAVEAGGGGRRGRRLRQS
jgi:hypothetical protein